MLSALSERDESAEIVSRYDSHPSPTPTSATENVPLKEDISSTSSGGEAHVPDAWIDEGKTKVGYEIPFTRHFLQVPAAEAAGGDRGLTSGSWRGRSSRAREVSRK
jgi:type I restriction enzyme M protein